MSSAFDQLRYHLYERRCLLSWRSDANDAQRARTLCAQALDRDPKQLGAKRVGSRVRCGAGWAKGDSNRARDSCETTQREGLSNSLNAGRTGSASREHTGVGTPWRTTKVSPGEIDRRLALLADNAGDLKEAQHASPMATNGEATDAALLYLADIAARDGDPDAALAGYADSRIRRSRSRPRSRPLRFYWLGANALSDAPAGRLRSDHPDTEFDARARRRDYCRSRRCGNRSQSCSRVHSSGIPSIRRSSMTVQSFSSAAGHVKESVEVLEKLLQDGRTIRYCECVGIPLADHGLDLGRAKGLIHKALLVTPDSPAVFGQSGWVRFARVT